MLAQHRLSETPQTEGHGPGAGLRGQTREVQWRVGEVINMPTLALIRREPEDEKYSSEVKWRKWKENKMAKEIKNINLLIKRKHKEHTVYSQLRFSVNTTVMARIQN